MFFQTIAQDLRIGLRVLVKEKGFCALAVTVLALGICGVTTMFSVVNGVMLRGFSYPNAERLVSAGFVDPTQGNNNNGNNGASFTAQGLRFDGFSETGVAEAGITTWRQPMIDHFSVFVSDCDFVNFDSGRNSAFTMRKSTYADTVSFVNCLFQNISGNALNLQAETDDTGRYNAEEVIIRNCLFRNVMGAALDLYRGSNDESTTGPRLRIDHCSFINVNNVELGSVLRLTGVQDGDVRNSLFVDSGQSGRAIKMEDQRWCRMLVSHCNLTNSGRIESFYSDRSGLEITRLTVDFADPENGDFNLAVGSPLAGKASDGGNLGARWVNGVLRE